MSDATNPVTSPLGGDDLAKALRDAYGRGFGDGAGCALGTGTKSIVGDQSIIRDAWIAQYIARLPAAEPIAAASEPRVGEDVGRSTRIPADKEHLLAVAIQNAWNGDFSLIDKLRAEIASAPSPEAEAGGDLGELDREQIARAIDPAAWSEWDAVMSRRAKSWTTYGDAEKAYYADAIAFVGGPGRKPSLEAADRILSIRSGKLVASTGSEEETKGEPITQDEIVKLIAKIWLTAKGTSDEDADEISDPDELALISPEDHAACVEIADTLLHRFAQAGGEVRHG